MVNANPNAPRRQHVKAAGVSPPTPGEKLVEGPGYQGKARTTSAVQHSSEVLHQTSKTPACPMRMAIGGLAAVGVLAYFTLYSKKKPEATAMDVAKVVTNTATPENTHPRK